MDKLVEKGLQMFQSRAADYIKDKGKLGKLLNRALSKGVNSEKLKDVWDNIQLFINCVRDWMSGEYRDISKSTIILVVAALLYLVSPFDIVSDFIPVTGLLDDITIIGFVFKKVAGDLESYKLWKTEHFSSQTIDVTVEEATGELGEENKEGITEAFKESYDKGVKDPG